ncbi:hypothetical protein [Streptococcus oralis]|jgi:hypothetical protein|uniref:LXG domain-containing protein n=1 Tax=Streptococcus oralis subsp. oralis TaxID=1891914 RepID=A0A7H9FI16_STROR|nr:hypothetical protein [Streptococcus oralis]MCY7087276.1 hypothetical protein [Streptococcus oralis]MDB6218697.1 hypothetical protein [Streptococcus oralis]QLL97518.1 hypothetical protein HRE59_00310 [Streptococcus oralis subsp. oralis]
MVKMVLGSSDTQGQTMASVGETRIASYDQAVSALSAFDNAGDLQGAAYDSGKQYGMNVITPLLKGAIMYTELVSEAVPKLPSKYQSEVGDEDLDSEVLESEIRSLEASLHSIRGMYNAMVGDESTSASTLSSLSNRMDDLLKQRNEKMDKLRKLNLFAGSSNEVFSVGEGSSLVDDLAQNIQTGLSQIETEFSSFSGTFPKHSAHTLGWAKNIEGEWDKKAKIDEDYQKVLEKIKDGKELSEDDVKALEAYRKRYGRDLPDSVNNALKNYVEKEINDIVKMISDASEAYKRGEIGEEALDSVINFLKQNGINISLEDLKKASGKLLEDSLISKLSDKWSELATEHYTSYILPYQVPYLINGLKSQIGNTLTKYGLSALLSTAPGSTVNKMVGETIEKIGDCVIPSLNKLDEFLGSAKFAKALPFGLGAAIDFAGQLLSGEELGDAAVKTGGHLGVTLLATAFLGPGGWAFAATVVGSIAFDYLYDKYGDKVVEFAGDVWDGTKKVVGDTVKSVGDTAEKIWNSAGDAVNGFFSGLGSVFN